METPTNVVRSNGVQREAPFWLVIAGLALVAWVLAPSPTLAMWFGFAIAGYSAIANDSIQTLGTFVSSNGRLPWWILAAFIALVLGATHVYGWWQDQGDIAFGRLSAVPQPTRFHFLQLAAPIALVVLTRYRMPVSTTFLLLSCFSAGEQIQKMLVQSMLGYIVAFVAALLLWSLITRPARAAQPTDDHEPQWWTRDELWRGLQWLSTTFLWATWIMHDTANVTVFLPRQLTLPQMLVAVGYLVVIVFILMAIRGGRIQQIVTEKTATQDVRAATLIDFTFAIVLLIFKEQSNIPMSTTWVFLGLLAGRELALTWRLAHRTTGSTGAMIARDIGRATAGLLVSLALAIAVQQQASTTPEPAQAAATEARDLRCVVVESWVNDPAEARRARR